MSNIVMIIVFMTGSFSAPITSLEVGFTTFQACEVARKHIVDNASVSISNQRSAAAIVVSHGCYARTR